MNTFGNAVVNQEARTDNDMKARKSTANACVDLFFKIGASRGKDIIPAFVAAYVEDRVLALRIVQWARDIRCGSGERQLFRDVLEYLEVHDIMDARLLLKKIPELGRWDDIFAFQHHVRVDAFDMIGAALKAGDALAAKWCPRKGDTAVALRKHLKMTPKQYRKTIVELTKVVETQMCAKDWDNIDFNKVPSLASSRYKKAFERNTTNFEKYVEALSDPDSGAKVNAGAVYPYDVLKGFMNRYSHYTQTQLNHVIAQWNALPNYCGENSSVLPMIDVSGSMMSTVGGNPNLRCLDVAVSLGLYVADKNTGKFSDMFLTFSYEPELVRVKGNIVQKVVQTCTAKWGMNTDLHIAFDKILSVAINGDVPQEEMPETLLIFSDMQFDRCVHFDDSAYAMINRKYEAAGYKVPKIVFWNLNSNDNVPVKCDQQGTALVSGFSPAILKSVLGNNMEVFSPENIMLDAIMDDRYSV